MKYKSIKNKTLNTHKDVLKKESQFITFSPGQLKENGIVSYFGVQVLFKCK
jgi:hypothetical protein